MWVWPLYETSISLLYPGNVSMVSVVDICQSTISWQCEYGLCGRHLPVYNILAMWVWHLYQTSISLLCPGNVSMASVWDICQSTISWQCKYGLCIRHLSVYYIPAMYVLCMRHLSVYYILAMWVCPLYETSVSLLYPGNVSMISVGDICQFTMSWQCEYGLCGRQLSVYYIPAMWVWSLYETSASLLYPGNVSMSSVWDICQSIISSQCEYVLCMRHLSVYYILAMWVWSLWETSVSLLYPGNVSMAFVSDIYQSTLPWQCEYGLSMSHLSVYYILAMGSMTSVTDIYQSTIPGNVSMASVWDIC